MATEYRHIGLLFNGIEFIPNETVQKHMPFATPPGTVVQAVYVRADEDEWEPLIDKVRGGQPMTEKGV